MICPVVMAGGTGSRLWPLSRQLNPKQFLALTDENQTMLQATLVRLDGLAAADTVVCGDKVPLSVLENRY